MSMQRLTPTHAIEYRTLMLEAYELHSDAFTSTVAERDPLPMSWWDSRLTDVSQAPELVVGAFMDGRLVGAAGLLFNSREKSRHKATLYGMYLRAGFRQQGLGRQIVQAALAEARARPGVRVVQLTVTQGNRAAQALYEQCGFVPFGVEPLAVAVDDGFVSKVHMWCDLGEV